MQSTLLEKLSGTVSSKGVWFMNKDGWHARARVVPEDRMLMGTALLRRSRDVLGIASNFITRVSR